MVAAIDTPERRSVRAFAPYPRFRCRDARGDGPLDPPAERGYWRALLMALWSLLNPTHPSRRDGG
jgi:hypothetical protein